MAYQPEITETTLHYPRLLDYGEKCLLITCSNCNHDNPDDAKFCQNCGNALELVCANCATRNSASAKFCKECGWPLKPDESHSPVQNHEEGRSGIGESERRLVTIVFCDIVGSTSIGERLDPEEWTEIMNDVFEHLIPPVTDYGGTPSRLLGDAVLAIFGAPVAHEDDPYRAVLAALAMLENFQPYRERIRERLEQVGVPLSPTDFDVRIGINTGLAIVGEVGSRAKREYTAMGDAVNLAARMEQTAEPGTIQIAHDTFLGVNSVVDLEPLEPLAVKGKREPVRAYRVLGLKIRKDSARNIAGFESPLIGRDQEINLLKNLLTALQLGRGQIVCLIGEGGLGKSRLVKELSILVENAPAETNWFKAESYSFEDSQPYALFRRLLRSSGDIGRDDSTEVAGRKLSLLLADLVPERRNEIERAFRTVLGLERAEGADRSQGEQFQREFFEGIRALTHAWAVAKPTVLVFEDLHWSDSPSIDLIKHLLPLTEEVPLLLACVFRPYTQAPAWTIKQKAESVFPHRYQEITLKPLTAELSNDLIGGLLNVSELPKDIGRLLAEKSSGVPFFIEEIVRDLIERGVLLTSGAEQSWQIAADVKDLHVPDSLDAVLVARMDRLDNKTRRTLQLAAVIGRSFYYRVLKVISDDAHQIDQQLQRLQQAQMIVESTRLPDLQYIFRHVLVQESAYNTILIRHRRLYHRQIGEAIEHIFRDQLDEQAPMLAHHFHKAGEEGRALKYTIMAADNAARLFANEESKALYKSAIKIVEELLSSGISVDQIQDEDTTMEETLARLNESQGDLLLLMGEYEAAREALSQSLSVLSDNQPIDQARLHYKVGLNWSSQQQFEEAAQSFLTAEEVLKSARERNKSEWYLIWLDIKLAQTDLLYWQNRYEEMSLLCDMLKDPISRRGTMRQQADYFTIMEMLIARQTRYEPSEDAVSYARKAMDLAEQIGDKNLIAAKSFSVGMHLLWQGKLDDAEKVFLDTLTKAKEIGKLALQDRAVAYLTITYRLMGNDNEVRFFVDEAMIYARDEGNNFYLGVAEANTAWLAYRAGRLEEAAAQAYKALNYWKNMAYPFQWLAHWILLDLALKNKALETAVGHATSMIHPDQQRLPDPISNRLKAAIDLWNERGKQVPIEDSLDQAVALAKENGYL